MNRYIKQAYDVLDGKEISKELALKLSEIVGTDLMDLLSLANKVNIKNNTEMHICSIVNIKNGKCSEDCKFCTQSAHYNTKIIDFPLLTESEILKEAETAINNNINKLGLVSSGKGFSGDSKELRQVLKLVKVIQINYPQLNICLALGTLDHIAANIVAEMGIYHYNHNLQVNPHKFASLVSTTHDIDERIKTITYLRERGVKVCSGGIFGLGETAHDRIELAFSLKLLDISVIPINILIPIEGTPIYNNDRLEIFEALKSTAIFRLIHPDKTIKLAAGRETILKDFQALFMLSGINGFLTGGYLTTRGRTIKDDNELLNQIQR